MTDQEIAQKVILKPITEITSKLKIPADSIEQYGKYKAKLPLNLINQSKMESSKLVLVSAINPTPAGEGKTTTTIGLTQGLNHLGYDAIAVLREPSLGPVFGMKGGATGGGYSQVLPMEDINLHFTGDFHAIEKAHNLLAALIDNNLQQKKYSLGIDPRTIRWKRVIDMNDRSLRKIVIGLGGTSEGVPRESGFDITAASEVMAILCLSKNIEDLKARLGNILVGLTYDKKPVFARELKAEGAMAALLKDAIKPNLVQTIEGNPAIIHGGPFANIAQGTNTVLATQMGLSIASYVITEAGFGFDLGGEKFLHIKCPILGKYPDAVVIVATIRALKLHGGTPLKNITQKDTFSVLRGCNNLVRHVENARLMGYDPIIAINQFDADDEEEITCVKEVCKEIKVNIALVSAWKDGGKGATSLAQCLVENIEKYPKPIFHPVYYSADIIADKIDQIAKKLYRAERVTYSPEAERDLALINQLGLNNLPICMAKTQKSFSDKEELIGAPQGYEFNIRSIEIANGAGFLVPIAGSIMRMPGLPPVPAAEKISLSENGDIQGLF